MDTIIVNIILYLHEVMVLIIIIIVLVMHVCMYTLLYLFKVQNNYELLIQIILYCNIYVDYMSD